MNGSKAHLPSAHFPGLVLAMPEGFEVHIDFSERVVADREALANGNTHANFDVCCGGSNCGC